MNTNASSDIRQFLISGARGDLDLARQQPLWSDPSLAASDRSEHLALALSAAESLGRLILLGEPPRGEDFLPPHVLRLAIAALERRIRTACEGARELGARWDREPDLQEREQMCLNAIQERTAVQAAYIGVLESLERLEDEVLDRELETVEEALRQYDLELASHEELLATVASDRLVRNLRDTLAEEFKSPPSWWLSEELKQLAQRTIEENEAFLARFRRNQVREQALSRALFFPGAIFQPALAAAKGGSRQLYLVWESPDRQIQAVCSVPWPAGPGPTVRVVFRSDNQEALRKIRGALVWLAGVEGQIGPDDTAEFQTERLWEAINRGANATLAVGHADAFWPVEPEALEEAKVILGE